MKISSLAGIGALTLLFAPQAIAQQLSDDGVQATVSSIPGSAPISRASCGTGTSIAAPFIGGNGFAGNMIDITVGGSDMTIECLDVNIQTAAGLPASIDVWYCPTTCVGNDMNQLANWAFLGTATGTSSGLNVPSKMDITGNGVTFSAGLTYGIYIDFAPYYNSGTGDRLNYTNGTFGTVWPGGDCDITTYYGKGTPSFSGSSFGSPGGSSRDWNGVLYTSAGPASPSLAQNGTSGGTMTFDFANYGAGETIAIVYGPGVAWATVAPCGPVSLDLTPLNFPPASSLIMITADGAGAAQLVQNVPAAGAGLLVQGVGVGTCGVSNSVIIP